MPGSRAAVYVDKYLFVGQDQSSVISHCKSHDDSLRRIGLPTHENIHGEQFIEYVGLQFDGNAHEVRVSWKRVWRLRRAIEFVLTYPFISGRQLEKLLGRITWSCLMRRE
eukprot:7956276-Karenia_brevis.AAC.1